MAGLSSVVLVAVVTLQPISLPDKGSDPSKMPVYAQPWFLLFNAEVEFHPATTPDDLKRAGLDAQGKKWG
jgi:hypothetical protein